MAENDFYRTLNYIKDFLIKKKIGFIQVNCAGGGISNINIEKRRHPLAIDTTKYYEYTDVMKELKSFLMEEKYGNINIVCDEGKINDIIVKETLNWKADKKKEKKA
ncbi:MAG: hypothetical protein HQ568_00330 [Calditrichaeota bacterium]|nr:hypothetical protein [Calditrichota bacterium]